MEKFLGRFCLVALLCLAVVMPGRAFIFPAGVLAPPAFELATGSVIAGWTALSAGVSAMLYAITLTDRDTVTDGLRLRVAPAAPFQTTDVPAGWSAAGNVYDPPVPPGTASSVPTYKCTDGGVNCAGATPRLTVAEAGTDWAALRGWPYFGSCVDPGDGDNWVWADPGSDGGTIGAGCSDASTTGLTGNFLSVGAQCPSGYVLSGGVCTLSDAVQVRFIADEMCGLYINSSGAINYDSRDPDCDIPPAGVSITDANKTLTVANPLQQVKVHVETDGSVTVTTVAASSAYPGQSDVSQVKIAQPAATATETQTSNIQSTAQAQVNAVGSSALSATPTVSTSNNAASQEFPTDYAREATLASTNTKLDTLHSDLTATGTSPTVPDAKTSTDIEGLMPDLSAFTGWTFPARSVSCPVFALDLSAVFGAAGVFDNVFSSACTLAEGEAATVSTVMLVIWALVAIVIVLSA